MSIPKLIHGYRPDPPHKRTQKAFARHFVGAAVSFPQEGAIKQFAGRTFDQGATGSCGGHGASQLTTTRLNAIGKPLPFVSSPDLWYKLTRSLERADLTPPGAPFPPLTDSGIMPTDLCRVASQRGVAPMRMEQTPDGRYSDVFGPEDDLWGGTNELLGDVNSEPDFTAIEDAMQALLVGEDRIDEQDSLAPSLIAACVGVKLAPVGLGIFVDSAFQAWRAGMLPLDDVNLGDPWGGGHWIALDHYYTAANGGLIFELHNSWSDQWGAAGRIQVTENWIRKAVSDIYPWAVEVKS